MNKPIRVYKTTRWIDGIPCWVIRWGKLKYAVTDEWSDAITQAIELQDYLRRTNQ